MLEWNPKWGVVPTFFDILDFMVAWSFSGIVFWVGMGYSYRSMNGNRSDNQYSVPFGCLQWPYFY